MTTTCTDTERCGQPQVGAGHPRKGWLNLKVAGVGGSTWWCSRECLVTGLLDVTPRPDVAVCGHCINRHERGHACPACGSRPQIGANHVIPATRLYLRAGHPERGIPA